MKMSSIYIFYKGLFLLSLPMLFMTGLVHANTPTVMFTVKISKSETQIYNGKEKVATLKPQSADISEMVLRPGAPAQLRASLSWLESKQTPRSPVTVTVTGIGSVDSNEVVFTIQGGTVFPKAKTETILKVGFDETIGSYYYDFDSNTHTDGTDLEVTGIHSIEYNELNPEAFPNNDKYYHWEFFYNNDGTLYRSAIRNDWDDFAEGGARRPYYYGTTFQPSQNQGHFIARGLHPLSNPAVFFHHADATLQPASATCAFHHETHLGFKPQKGRTDYRAHYRYVGLSAEKMIELFTRAKLFSPERSRLNLSRFLYKNGINTFGKEQLLPNSEPLTVESWRGPYTVTSNRLQKDDWILELKPGDWTRISPQRTPNQSLQMSLLFEKKSDGERLIIHAASTHDYDSHEILPPHRRWFTVQLPLTPKSPETSLSIEFYNAGQGKVWLDNVGVLSSPPQGIFSRAFERFTRIPRLLMGWY